MKIIFILCSVFLLLSCDENVNTEKSKPSTIELNISENGEVENNLINHKDSITYAPQAKIKSDSLRDILSTKDTKIELDSILEKLKTKVQTFTINSSEDNLIQGKEGTQVLIPKNTFNYDEEVTLKLKESYSKSSYLFDCLSTQTDSGELLETAGMIELRAYANSEEIQLAENKEVTIKFPVKGEKKGDFNLFNQSIRKDSIVEWKLNPNGKDGFCLFEIDIKAGFDHVHLKGSRRELDFLTQKEKDLLARRMQNSISQRFPLLCESKESGKINFSSRFYEKDKMFYDLLSKIGNNLNSLGFDINDKLRDDMTINFTFGNPNSEIDIAKYNKIVAERDKLTEAEKIGKKRQEKFLEQQRQAQLALEKKLLDSKDYYTLTSNTLGWINCDRFRNDTNKVVDMIVRSETKNEKFMFYVKSYNGALRAFPKEKNSTFFKIPENLLGVLVGIKKEKNKVYITKKKVKASEKTIEGFEYEKVAVEELKKRVEELAKF